MKLIQTLTDQQMIDIFEGNVDDIFRFMFPENSPLRAYRNDICRGYYFYHSGEKEISPAYLKYKMLWEKSSFGTGNIGSYIAQKFLEKWTRIHKALIEEEYNPLKNIESVETKTANNKDTDTYDTSDVKTGNNVDTATYDTSVVTDGETSSKETTTRSLNDNNNIYGFNSDNPVGDTSSTENMTETVEALPADNTTHNDEKKTGTDTNQHDINESFSKTGTVVTDIEVNENTSKQARDISGAELIEQEILVRNRNIFFDIIYKDIDSVLVLSVY